MFRAINRKIMFKTMVRLTPSFVFPIFNNSNKNDQDMLGKSVSTDSETGWDRVKNMYRRNEFDEFTIELNNVAQNSFCGFIIGACFGGFVKSRDAYLYFIESNQASIFTTTFEAKKKLQDYVTVAFAKGAYHWGWRVGLFTGMFSLIATTISVYNGDTSILEYVIAGAFTGALYKASLGTAGMLVGGLLGAALSTLGGLLILGILKVSGITMDDVRKSLYKLREARYDQYNQAVEKSATEKHDDLTRHHDKVIEDKGEKKIEDIL